MEAELTKAIAEGYTEEPKKPRKKPKRKIDKKKQEEIEKKKKLKEERKKKRESPPEIIGEVETTTPGKIHPVLHYKGRSYNFKCMNKDGVMTHTCVKKNTEDIKCIGYIRSILEVGKYKIIYIREHCGHPLDNYSAFKKEFTKELKQKASSVDSTPSKVVGRMFEELSAKQRLKLPREDSLRRMASREKQKLLPSIEENPASKTLIGK